MKKRSSTKNLPLKIVAAVVVLTVIVGVVYYSPIGENWRLSSQAKSYVGLTSSDAKSKAAEEGLRYRVINKNGQHLVTSDDYVSRRINVSIRDGKIIEAKFDKMLGR